MAKKIMVVSDSPQKNGNTNTVVGWFVEGAKETGASVQVIDVTKLKSKFGGCKACM